MHDDAGSFGAALEAAVATTEALVRRIWDRDHTVWQDDPTEVVDRLGWLDCPTAMRDRVDEFRRLAADVRADGIEHVLLVGMGGSSLYPEVLATAFPLGSEGLADGDAHGVRRERGEATLGAVRDVAGEVEDQVGLDPVPRLDPGQCLDLLGPAHVVSVLGAGRTACQTTRAAVRWVGHVGPAGMASLGRDRHDPRGSIP